MNTFRIDRQKQKKTVEFETLHREHVEVWDHLHDSLYENNPATHQLQLPRIPILVPWCHTDQVEDSMDPSRLRRP